MHQQVSTQLGGLPLNIVYISDGRIGLTPRGVFPIVIDNPEQGLSAIITNENILIDNDEEASYNVALSQAEYPKLWAWITQQNLVEPTF